MLMPMYRAWIAVLALVLFGWIAWSYTSYVISSQSPPAHEQYSTDPDAQKHRTDEAIARYTLGVMIFTGILAIATVGLGIATGALYYAGVSQLNLAREEFTR